MDGSDRGSSDDRGYLICYLEAAAKLGLVRPELAMIGDRAGVSPASVRMVLQGGGSPAMRAKVLGALGLRGEGSP